MKKELEKQLEAIDAYIKGVTGIDLQERLAEQERRRVAYACVFAGLYVNTYVDKNGNVEVSHPRLVIH